MKISRLKLDALQAEQGLTCGQVAEKAGMTKKDAEKAVAAVLETVTETLKKGDKITLTGFGSFEVKTRAAHAGINPKTRKPITIAASKAPVFKAGKALKDAVK